MIRLALEGLIHAPEEMEKLRPILAWGKLFAIPTDTFYGLAVLPRHDAGVRRIFEAKGRDDGKPLPVVAGYLEQLEGLGVEAPQALEGLKGIWPAPLTAVLPLREPIAASRGRRSLAVRIPADERLRRLLSETGPLTATSANRSGEAPAQDPDAVAAALAEHIDVLIDGGRCPGGLPSTIVDFTVEPPRMLRAGAFPWPPDAKPAP
jgi:L-threonylcarbamoyladenylate synthase